MDLGDKGALVTGAASGIGRATAELLAERGCRVAVVDRDEDGGKAVADAVGGLFVACDVASSAAVNAAFARCAQELGRLDIAHLNAGVATDVTDITQLSDDEYRRMMGVNVDGVLFGTRAAARIMREQNGGAIVATASLAGIMAFAPDPLYTLTKHAVVGLVRSAAEGLATHGITINAVCPGFTDTNILTPATKASLREFGFALIEPRRVAEAVLLAIESGETGQCWICQPGLEPLPYQFRGVPGPRVDRDPSAPTPDANAAGRAFGTAASHSPPR